MKRTPEMIIDEYKARGRSLNYIRVLAVGCGNNDLRDAVSAMIEGGSDPDEKIEPVAKIVVKTVVEIVEEEPQEDEIKEVEVEPVVKKKVVRKAMPAPVKKRAMPPPLDLGKL